MDSFIYDKVNQMLTYAHIINEHLQGTPFLYYFDLSVDYVATHHTTVYLILSTCFIFLIFTHALVKTIINGIVNKRLAALTKQRPRILNEGHTKRILILGDSTAYGTGSNNVEETIAGRFAHDFQDVETHNYAVNGSVTKDVFLQLDNVGENQYNLVIISTGGNDTWKFSNIEKVAVYIREVIERSKRLSNGNVVLIIYNNIASGPVFPFFIRGTLLRRTDRINKLFIQIANELNIEPVPIFLEGEKCPKNFFARDGLHPSSEGYRIMYVRLWSVLYRRMYDFKLRDI